METYDYTPEQKVVLDEKEDIFNDEFSAIRSMQKSHLKYTDENGEPLGVHYNSRVLSVQAYTRNLNEDFRYDIATNQGIILRSPEAFDKHGEKIWDGLQSPFFGSDYTDDDAYNSRFSCQCGKYVGQCFADGIFVCPECGSKVEFNDTDLRKTGWVYLHGYKVLSPIFYMKLKKFLGTVDNKSILELIIKVSNKRINDLHTQGEIDLIEKYKCPFIGKGLTWLSENIDEVLDYYAKKKSSLKLLYNELKFSTHKMFTGALPIYSATLRTEMPGVKDCKLYKMKINTYFQAIIRCSNTIKEQKEMPVPEEVADVLKQTIQEEIDIQLDKIQEHTEKVFDEEFNLIGNKKGIINSKIIGGRNDWTSRAIIVPGGDVLGANEVILPYLSYLALFRFEIISMYIELYGAKFMDACNAIEMAADDFDPDVYQAMTSVMRVFMKTNYHMNTVMISRNPCINFGSHNEFIIKGIKKSISDKTVTINTRILTTMNADFDGDQINIYRILGGYIKDFHQALDPIVNHYIDGRTGYVNKALLPSKDEIAVANEIFTLPDKIPLGTNGLPDMSKAHLLNEDDTMLDNLPKSKVSDNIDLAEASANMIMFDLKRALTAYTENCK